LPGEAPRRRCRWKTIRASCSSGCCGGSGSTDRAVRAAQIATDRSILDSVRDRVARLQGRIGPKDRVKLEEYLEAVRDIERRIRKAEEQSDRELPLVERPRGVPASFEEHARLMFDLQLLASKGWAPRPTAMDRCSTTPSSCTARGWAIRICTRPATCR
jgi:hypothetical protein